MLPFGSLRARLARGTLWSALGTAGSQILGLVASVVTARLLGQAGFGELGVVLGTLTVLGNLAGLGPAVSATKHIAEFRARDTSRVANVMGASVLLASLIGLTVAVGVLGSASYLAKTVLNGPRLSGPVALGSVLVFLNAIGVAQSGALAGFEAFQAAARVSLVRGLVSLPLAVAGVYLYGVIGAVGASVMAASVAVWQNHRALSREIGQRPLAPSFRNQLAELGTTWRFSLPAFVAGALPGPVVWGATILLVHQANGQAEMGLFSAADQWRAAVVAVPAVVGSVTLPLLANLRASGDRARYARLFWRSLGLNALVSGLAALLAITFAPQILSLYGKSFGTGRMTLALLALAGVLVSVNGVIGNGIIAGGWIWWGVLFNVLWGGALLGFWGLLLPYGARGLALAYVLAYSAHTCWQMVFLLGWGKKRL